MATEMVVRIRNALIEADPAADDRSLPMPTSTYDDMARAAIRAMEDPTEEMLTVLRKALGGAQVYKAACRTALGEDEGNG